MSLYSTEHSPAVDAPMHRRPAVRFADIAVVSGVLGMLAMLPLPSALRAALLAVLVFVGPGAAIQTWIYVPPRARFAAVPILSISVFVLVTTAAMWGYQWSPRWITAIVVGLQIASSVLWYRKHGEW
ncbi:hypothetical protein, partial [Bradyrhizobium canariense]|uniref:hypothetical protein n=1 Tax=Bradyrhizobium canariense TaxID=255045 RepID=UPI0018E97646